MVDALNPEEPRTHYALEIEDLNLLRPDDLFDCSSSTAVVVGAGGVGSWVAAGLAAAGANLVLVDVDGQRVEHLVAKLSDVPGRVDGFVGDMSERTEIERLLRFADQASSEPLKIMVNTAAVNRRMPAVEVDEETYDQIMGVDLRMPFFLSQAMARAMIDADGGSLIHISSTNARFGLQSTSVYAAAKAGLDQLARTLAVELAPHQIRVNCVAPGFLMTDLSRPLWDEPTKRSWILDRVPLSRPGSPRELVGVCLLLASQAGSFITGQTFAVDGGFLAGNSWLSDTSDD